MIEINKNLFRSAKSARNKLSALQLCALSENPLRTSRLISTKINSEIVFLQY